MPTEVAPSHTTPVADGISPGRPAAALGIAEDLLLGTALVVVVTIAVVVLAAALVAAVVEAVMSSLPSRQRREGRSLGT